MPSSLCAVLPPTPSVVPAGAGIDRIASSVASAAGVRSAEFMMASTTVRLSVLPLGNAAVTPSTRPTAAVTSETAAGLGGWSVTDSTTTVTLLLARVNSVISFCVAIRAGESAGRPVWSRSPRATPEMGAQRTASTPMMATATRTGLRITRSATVPQNLCARASPRSIAPVRQLSESMRGPRRASAAGNAVSEITAATATAAMPPMPSERIIACGKMSMPMNAQISSSAENATVRPAVDIVQRTASTVPCPLRSSSRNRVITNRL